MTPFSKPAGAETPGMAPDGGRPLTGRRVLAYLLAFFLLIIAVNGVMAAIATGSFRGVVAENGYVESLRFSAFEKRGAAALQEARPLPGAATGDGGGT
ncbi:MAG: FixH family protein [Sneathiellaceae bacterium]